MQRGIEEVKDQWGLGVVIGVRWSTAGCALDFPYDVPGGGCPVGWPGKIGSPMLWVHP